MKLSWIVQGPPEAAWSYFIQIRLFTKYANRAGHTANIIQFSDPHQDLQDIVNAITAHKPDILLTIGDIHLTSLADITHLSLISIVTNGTGIVPPTKPLTGVTFACTSHFAQKLFQANGLTPTTYLPHGFDPEIFHPENRLQSRQKLNWHPTAPIIVMVGTNYPLNPLDATNNPTPDRKNWLGGLTAFKHLLKNEPSARLYLHTNAQGAADLPQLIHQLNIAQSVDIATTTNTHPQSHLATLYQAANVLLFPSIGESFGVPLIEAQACGLPVVTTHTGPLSEIVKTGTAVASTTHPTFPGWGIPDTAALTKALLQWLKSNSPNAISKKIQAYNITTIMNQSFLPLIKKVKS